MHLVPKYLGNVAVLRNLLNVQLCCSNVLGDIGRLGSIMF